MTYVVTDSCIDVKDKKCAAECPVDCIYIGDRMAYIHPDECIDCGACVSVCPVAAIYYEADLPETLRSSLQRQIDVFQAVGSPGGARTFGAIVDHPDLAATPPNGAISIDSAA
jgi:ferredoxin